MAPKGSSHGRSAARTAQIKAIHEKRAIAASTTNSSASTATADAPDGVVPEDTARIQMLQQTVIELETALQIQQDLVAQLTQNLANEKEQSRMLLAKVDAEKEHSKQLYKVMRVEKRARQREQARKALMEGQIKLLKSADVRMSMNLKEATGDASKAIDALLTVEKENTTLRSELSRSLQLYTSELAAANKKLNVVGEKMKEYKGQAAKFKKRCDRAAAVQANALKRATDRLKKESSVHHLLHKGVYTEKTRALIKLLVQAGCSREYVGEVIHEVFRTAGISVHGNISRSTVSRVILEGYVAAKIQLGFEMDNADSMTFGADGTTHRDINYNA
jgi:chromosome segregation ATPase